MAKAKCLMLFAMMAAAVALSGWDAHAGHDKDKKGDKTPGDNPNTTVVGARWEYEVWVKDSKGERTVLESGKFRAHDFKISVAGTEIGTYAQSGKNEYKLDITKGKLKGKITLELTDTKPRPIYRGPCNLEGHGKCHITVKFLDD
jgi:hypothetical protein